MNRLEIAEVATDADGRLPVRPAIADARFRHIYRAAAGVHRIPTRACFACPQPREWSYVRWFGHARAAVQGELGLDFEVTDTTSWRDVPDDVRAGIRGASEPREA